MTGADDARPEPGPDFYISYAGQDRLLAEWVGKQLGDAGYEVVLDVWSWLPGDDKIMRRQDALRRAGRVLALCSPAYFSGAYTKQDWTAMIAAEHREPGRLIPILIQDVDEDQFPDLLRSVQPIKLTDVSTEEASRRLLTGLSGQLGPDKAPPSRARRPKKRSGRHHSTAAAWPAEELPGTEPPDMWRVPPRNLDFTGRDDVLIQIREALLSGSPGRAILQGLGGVGKTQLSTEYAHRFATDYDIVWVIDAEQAGLIPSQLADLADSMDLPTSGAAQAATAVINALRTQTRWLLVFDNVENPDDIMSFLPDGAGHVLITARTAGWDEVGTSIAVEEFSRAESTALLSKRVGRLPRQDADAIAEALGDLPLALAQATGTLRAGLSAAEFQRLLNTQATQVLSRGKPRSYSLPLAAATLVASDKLAAADPKATNLLMLCGYLAPEVIPAEWLYSVPAQAGVITAADAGELPDGPLEVTDAFQRISDFGLGRVDQQGLKLHRLTQAILRDHTADEQDGYRARVIAMLAAVAPGDTEDPTTWPQWARLVPHLLTVPIDRAPAAFRPLACAAARYLILNGQATAAVSLAERLHKTWTAELGPDDIDTLAAGEQLGHALYESGDYARTLDVNQDTYDRRRRVLGEDDRDTLLSGNNLAVSLSAIGRITEALPIVQDVYKAQRQILGSDDPDTLLSAGTLANALNEVGQKRKALSLEREVLEGRRRVLGNDHPITLSAAEALAVTLGKVGQLPEVLALQREVLEGRRRVLGDDHPDTLHAAANMSGTLAAVGRAKDALRPARNAHEKLARLLGDDNPRTLNAVAALVCALAGLGRWNEALPVIREFMARHRQVLGEDNSVSLQIESAFGLFLLTARRPREAHPYNQDVYERRVRVLGEDHPDTVRAAEMLANNLEALGRRAEAIRLRHGRPKGPQKR